MSARSPFSPTEKDVARAAIAELQRHGYETFEEVEASEGRADVVGRRGAEVIVVECKVSMSLAVLAQGLRWKGLAHRVLVVVGRGKADDVAAPWLKYEGVGLWLVWGLSRDDSHPERGSIREVVAPQFFRKANTRRLVKGCHDETRTGSTFAVAGSHAGGYWTPFKGTARSLAIVVAENPGITLREALAKTTHHYRNDRSGRSSLPGLIRKGVIEGVRAEDDHGKLRLYPVELPGEPLREIQVRG